MNAKLAHLLTLLYPRLWRERYGAEFEAFLQNHQGGLRGSANVVCSALHERIFPTREGPMDQNSRSFQCWCIRAPWAIFGLAPLFLLAMAYVVACLYLWSGWKIFLPGADTPFVQGGGPIYGIRNIYFQTGKFYYFGAPVLVGWVTALTAVRQRVKSAWLVIGLILIAWMGSAAQIHASQTAVHWGLGHISMDFPLNASLHSVYQNPLHALTILLLTVLPYLTWLVRRTNPGPFSQAVKRRR
jgi:hypothetical protein